MASESQETFDRIAGPLQNPMTESHGPEQALRDILNRIKEESQRTPGEIPVEAAPGWLTALRDAKAVQKEVNAIYERDRSRIRSLLKEAKNHIDSMESMAKDSMRRADREKLEELSRQSPPGKIVRVPHEHDDPGYPYIRVDSEGREKLEVENEDDLPRRLMIPDMRAIEKHYKEFRQAPNGTRVIIQHGTRIHANSGKVKTGDRE